MYGQDSLTPGLPWEQVEARHPEATSSAAPACPPQPCTGPHFLSKQLCGPIAALRPQGLFPAVAAPRHCPCDPSAIVLSSPLAPASTWPPGSWLWGSGHLVVFPLPEKSALSLSAPAPVGPAHLQPLLCSWSCLPQPALRFNPASALLQRLCSPGAPVSPSVAVAKSQDDTRHSVKHRREKLRSRFHQLRSHRATLSLSFLLWKLLLRALAP